MKLTNEEKRILKILLLNEINYYENENDCEDYTKKLENILKKLVGE